MSTVSRLWLKIKKDESSLFFNLLAPARNLALNRLNELLKMTVIFDHEKLHVYRASIDFIVWLQKIMPDIPKRHAVYDQLDRASTSISLNIAEGNGKSLPRDRCRFFEIARGSALECAAALDVLAAKGIFREKKH